MSGRAQRDQGGPRDTKRNRIIIKFLSKDKLIGFKAPFDNRDHFYVDKNKELYHQSLDGANGGRKKTRNKDKCPRLMEKQEIS